MNIEEMTQKECLEELDVLKIQLRYTKERVNSLKNKIKLYNSRYSQLEREAEHRKGEL
jgi:hypothetical protein